MPPPKRRFSDSPAVIVIEDDVDAPHPRRLPALERLERVHRIGRTSGPEQTIELTPDLIVLDLAMPKVDGWTVLKRIRESSATAHIPVVVVSALSDARDDAFAAGCDAYLMKPCTPEVVYLQLRALLRLKGVPVSV